MIFVMSAGMDAIIVIGERLLSLLVIIGSQPLSSTCLPLPFLEVFMLREKHQEVSIPI